MNNNISSQITNHLEFLGYKVEDISDDKIDFLRKVYRKETADYNKDIILKIVKEG